MRIVNGFVEHRCRGVNVHLHGARAIFAIDKFAFAVVATVANRFVGANDHCPQHASCAEFCNLHKVVSAHAHVEFDGASSRGSIYASLGEHFHVLIAPSQSIAKFLSAISTSIVQTNGIDRYYAIFGQHFASLDNGFCQVGHHLFVQLFAFQQHAVQRVEVDRAFQRLEVVAAFFVVVGQQTNEVGRATNANREVQLDAVGSNAFKQRGDVVGRELLFVEFETERIDAFVQHIECFCVGSFGIVCIDVLPNIPNIVDLCATHIRIFSRCGIGRFQPFQVLGTIERLHIEAFGRAPNQFLVEIGSFQIDCDFVQPFLRRNGWKISQKI